ncbi:tRNA 5-methoxyuridine(34)/uridine 5-oxyacetic acid(34) synthase CmoB [Thiocystis violacea]|uniref:tRNA 5-methoxyuridine(34)/uridine 5-oxyacetic acid(34) synthase CmoB n=1 Tax=Thiocystis violacea TaxID=13725 RepID=UPI001902C6B1|nr:tRNA 5-methoxyuridine(34)/uridine 5-oxyacetic acid(34) synthase CmoB [Thiocystis violacea]MBK1721084.1 tRNA 5-methoxyuridine(34)/uridine 5-oxyacetic acid(34) synthase CmoB [Thiocystis violacea]
MDLSTFEPFLERLSRTRLAPWRAALAEAVERRLGPGAHGDLPRWEAAVAALPELSAGRVMLDQSRVGVLSKTPLDAATEARLRDTLMALHPWRKGPFCIHGVHIDTEWRSDLKWDRLADAIAPLAGRLVLDVGCGNGYHGWRMLGAGAELVLGIDPTLLFVVQFQAINRYLAADNLSVLPLGIEDLPEGLTGLDSVFSMGVLYHRRLPIDHLADLFRLLRPGGELVLETLVLDASAQQVLVPRGRYASMRNVWFIPSVDALVVWLERCGFNGVEVIDVKRTSTEEQRGTDWMRFQSLPDHLDPDDPSRTLEGHPAPTRALLIANRP